MKDSKKKLALNRKTIFNLSQEEMNSMKGGNKKGILATGSCPTDFLCPTLENNCTVGCTG